MYDWFNRGRWDKCFSLVDPALKEKSRTELSAYTESLRRFQEVYGTINPWLLRISLHLDTSANKHDDRPFAYVYVVWQDEVRGFHMFRERWVKHEGGWFTRVVGLVANRQEPVRNQS